MKKYVLTSDRKITVDYLGVFDEGVDYELTDYAVTYYEAQAGIPLAQENLPEGVSLKVTETKEAKKTVKPDTEGGEK